MRMDEVRRVAQEKVEEIARDFKTPDDDFHPVFLLIGGDGEVTMIPPPPHMVNSDFGKDVIATVVATAARAIKAQACVQVQSTWMLKLESPEDQQEYERRGQPLPSEWPEKRVEQVIVVAMDGEAAQMFYAPIHRDGVTPPTIGDWDSFPSKGYVEGRFITPIQEALR